MANQLKASLLQVITCDWKAIHFIEDKIEDIGEAKLAPFLGVTGQTKRAAETGISTIPDLYSHFGTEPTPSRRLTVRLG
jgi:hypothetical protein